jgi:hypothetical protein
LISFNAIYKKNAYLPEAAHYGAKRTRIMVASPRHIAVRREFSLFGFCLPFVKTKCAKLAIANPPSEGGEKEVVR